METIVYAISWVTCLASVASLTMSLTRMLDWDYWDRVDWIVAGVIVASLIIATIGVATFPFVALAR